jgi:hypothetical protein
MANENEKRVSIAEFRGKYDRTWIGRYFWVILIGLVAMGALIRVMQIA